jgi:hypothetical protein
VSAGFRSVFADPRAKVCFGEVGGWRLSAICRCGTIVLIQLLAAPWRFSASVSANGVMMDSQRARDGARPDGRKGKGGRNVIQEAERDRQGSRQGTMG